MKTELSPRDAWMNKHLIQVFQQGGTWIAKSLDKGVMIVGERTQHDALKALAEHLNIKLWNEQ